MARKITVVNKSERVEWDDTKKRRRWSRFTKSSRNNMERSLILPDFTYGLE